MLPRSALPALRAAATDGPPRPAPSPLSPPPPPPLRPGQVHFHRLQGARRCVCSANQTAGPIVRPRVIVYTKLQRGSLRPNFKTDLFSRMKTSFSLRFSAFLNSQDETKSACRPLSPQKRGLGASAQAEVQD